MKDDRLESTVSIGIHTIERYDLIPYAPIWEEKYTFF